MREFKLDNRLQMCADMVTKGARVVDVGTDHAYLPIWLIRNKKVKSAIASDINKLPLIKARNNVQKYGLENEIELVQSDGLAGIDHKSVDEIIISGMGGELISQIIFKAIWIKKYKKRLILQPMSSAYDLRIYLSENSFLIEEEKAVFSLGRVYTIISAVHTEIKEKMPIEYPYIGKLPYNIDDAAIEYMKYQIRDLHNRAKGAYAKNNMDIYSKNLHIIEKIKSIIDANGGIYDDCFCK